jgi:hypothetical protein
MKFANKKDAKMCALCKKRPNTFSTGGKYKRDQDHDLCRQCHKSLSDSDWQRRNASRAGSSEPSSGSQPSALPPFSSLTG